ncbi:hypothetical protein HK098_007624 [Nowakowskiella sp. JEL0407]|nr:hypothetical protein HK098_007624 [Nowakowskiella sp. JEL0407]
MVPETDFTYFLSLKAGDTPTFYGWLKTHALDEIYTLCENETRRDELLRVVDSNVAAFLNGEQGQNISSKGQEQLSETFNYRRRKQILLHDLNRLRDEIYRGVVNVPSTENEPSLILGGHLVQSEDSFANSPPTKQYCTKKEYEEILAQSIMKNLSELLTMKPFMEAITKLDPELAKLIPMDTLPPLQPIVEPGNMKTSTNREHTRPARFTKHMSELCNKEDMPLKLNETPTRGRAMSISSATFPPSQQPLKLIVKEEINTKYWEYYRTAKKISKRCDPLITNLVDLIQQLASMLPPDPDSNHGFSTKPIPYVFLDGSKGVGKTQTTLTIAESLKNHNIFYILLDTSKSDSQEFYKNFKSISNAFRYCLDLDLANLKSKNVNSNFTETEIYNNKFYLFGFISSLLSMKGNLTDLRGNRHELLVHEQYGYRVFERLTEMGLREKRPVFEFDECPGFGTENFLIIRFLHAIFLPLGIPLVLSGTHSRAFECFKNVSPHIPIGPVRDLFYFNCTYPQIDAAEIPDIVPNVDLLRYIIANSRPLFGKLIIEYCSKIGFFKEGEEGSDHSTAFDRLAEYLNKKCTPNEKSQQWMIACLQMFLNSSYQGKEGEIMNPFVTEHYAVYVGGNFLLKSNGKKEDGSTWDPRSCFPAPDKDPALYLALAGGKNFPSFVDSGERVPCQYYLQSVIKCDHQYLKNNLEYRNRNQPSNDGMEFEALATAAVGDSSHSKGVAGMSLKEFLEFLNYNLRNVKGEAVPHIDQASFDHFFANLRDLYIPFLSPPNSPWPKQFRDVGCRYGDLDRMRNTDRIDLSIAEALSGECKDYGEKIPLKVMKLIIQRVEQREIKKPLHVVFVRSLQNSYFSKNKETYDSFKKDMNLSNMCFLKVEVGESPIFEEIKGLPGKRDEADVVVLFVVVPPTRSKTKRKRKLQTKKRRVCRTSSNDAYGEDYEAEDEHDDADDEKEEDEDMDSNGAVDDNFNAEEREKENEGNQNGDEEENREGIKRRRVSQRLLKGKSSEK